MILEALLMGSSYQFRAELLKEDGVIGALRGIALQVQTAFQKGEKGEKGDKTEQARELLRRQLVKANISDVRLPIDPTVQLASIVPSRCTFFSSKTTPLLVTFLKQSYESDPTDEYRVIFKVGDDMRQETLITQMLRVMAQVHCVSFLNIDPL